MKLIREVIGEYAGDFGTDDDGNRAVKVRFTETWKTPEEFRELRTALAAAHEQIEALTAERERLREAQGALLMTLATAQDKVAVAQSMSREQSTVDHLQDVVDTIARGRRAALRTADEGEGS